MNYQELESRLMVQNSGRYIMKNKRYEKACCSAKTSLQNSIQKKEIKTENNNDRKNENQNRLKSLIKINKNIQNAFPENFFSNKKTWKADDEIKSNKTHENKTKINLEKFLALKSQQKLGSQKQSRTQLTKADSKPVWPHLFLMQEKPTSNRFKIKSIKSSRTSIQKKNEMLFSFEKDQSKILPKTAQTLDNYDEEQLMIITFGNNFGKGKNSVQSSQLIQNQENSDFSKILEQTNSGKYHRMKNMCSLELKSERLIQSSRKKRSIRNQNQYEKLGYLSDRKYVPLKQQYFTKGFETEQKKQSNPFKKIRLDVEQLLKRKTFVLPKMKNIHQNAQINKKLSSKREKLPF